MVYGGINKSFVLLFYFFVFFSMNLHILGLFAGFAVNMLRFIPTGGKHINPSNECWGYFCPKHNGAKIFGNHLNPVMLIFIG